MRGAVRTAAAVAAVAWCACSGVAAQEKVTLGSDVLLYGDNTEFRNPFREGETIFGAAVRVVAAVTLNSRVTMSLGAFGNQRFGSDESFEQVRPVISLTTNGRRSAFVFGAFPAMSVRAPIGPDRSGPHALLPPLQRETLSYDRPYEAGLQWTFNGTRLTHDIWLDWQRLITPEHRERFDGGLNGSWAVASHVSVPLQFHAVHQGGQKQTVGPVADSYAGAIGVDVHGRVARVERVSLEVFGLGSRYVPDRQVPSASRTGKAFFARAAAEQAGWRAHLIVWRGRNYIKDEGDPNYQSLRHDGRYYGGIRDYAEAGLARRFTLAPGAVLEMSGRLHRTERFYEYSYRVFAIAAMRWRIH